MYKPNIISGIILFLTLLLVFFYTSPLIESQGRLDMDREVQRAEYETARITMEKAKEAQASMEKMTEAEKQQLVLKIPVGMNQQGIISALSSLATLNGMTLSSVSFSKATLESLPKRVSVLANFSGAGTIESFLRLLQSIERNDRLMMIQQISLTLSQQRSDGSLTIDTFYLPDPK